MHPQIGVIYEDQQILVIDKPAGLVSEDISKGFLVHRLDKDTSGSLIIAKTEKALGTLQEEFRSREVKKQYLALVHGEVSEPGLIDVPIIRNPNIHNAFIAIQQEEESRLAATKYEPIESFQFSISNFKSIFNDLNEAQIKKLQRMKYNEFTLLRCFPLTGRTHQIRVHLKYIHHPIVSDFQYAGRKIYKLDQQWCPRQFLHAAKISFYHPETKEWMELESPLPEDLKKVLDLLKI